MNIYSKKASTLYNVGAFLTYEPYLNLIILGEIFNQIIECISSYIIDDVDQLTICEYKIGLEVTVILNKNVSNSIIIDKMGNIILGLSDAEIKSLLIPVHEELNWDVDIYYMKKTSIHKYVIDGVIPYISLINSIPVLCQNSLYKYFDITDNTRFIIYDLKGFGTIKTVSEIEALDTYKQFCYVSKDPSSAKSNEETHNINVFNCVKHRKFLKAINYTTIKSDISDIVSFLETNNYEFLPYKIKYGISFNKTIIKWFRDLDLTERKLIQKHSKVETISLKILNDSYSVDEHIFNISEQIKKIIDNPGLNSISNRGYMVTPTRSLKHKTLLSFVEYTQFTNNPVTKKNSVSKYKMIEELSKLLNIIRAETIQIENSLEHNKKLSEEISGKCQYYLFQLLKKLDEYAII
jgi:hypothetical protein